MTAGSKNAQGYIAIKINGQTFKAHRIAWMMETGSDPLQQIDHKNGIRHDNRWCNLRDVTRSVNLQNLRGARSDSATGLLGAWPCVGGFTAQINVNGKRLRLGTFSTAEQAHAAYLDAKRQHHAGCTI